MKYCRHCGAQLADDDNYCYFCGKPIEEEKIEQPVFQDHSYYEDKTLYNRETNTAATLGFIFSFISPIVGLIISIIGLNKSRRLNGLGRGKAIAGIIISILSMVISFFIYMYYLEIYGLE